MGKFKLIKKIDLDSFGDNWKECYLSFYAPTYKEIKKFALIQTEEKDNEKAVNLGIETIQETIKSLFIEGFANGDNGKFAVKKEDLNDLPVEMTNYIVDKLIGKPSPN